MREKVILAIIQLLHKRLFRVLMVRHDGSMSHLNKKESLNDNNYRVSV